MVEISDEYHHTMYHYISCGLQLINNQIPGAKLYNLSITQAMRHLFLEVYSSFFKYKTQMKYRPYILSIFV